MLAERGIIVSYESVRRWCLKFGPRYQRSLKRREGRLGDDWFIDEVFEAGDELLSTLNSVKWSLWHGNVQQALDCLDDCYGLCDDTELRYNKRWKLLHHLSDMITYIDNNSQLIPNYGEKYRYGETITTAFVESTVNEVVAKRMVKKQQMQWSNTGAHYLLQTRTAVLNGELRGHFEGWYPELTDGKQAQDSTSEMQKAA